MNGKKLGFLGPKGTYTEQAAILMSEEMELVAYEGIINVISAVESNAVDEGIIPIENSIEGGVNISLDRLALVKDLRITGEISVPIEHVLMSRSKESQIKRIYSHPHAIAQCRKSILRNFPGAEIIETSSTSRASLISLEDRSAAAIGSRYAAELYGLKVIASNISDYDNNFTRFVRIGKKYTEPSGNDKTSIVFSPMKNQPGTLFNNLKEFAIRGINLTFVMSRPTKDKLGSYLFFLDMLGHVREEKISEALGNIEQKSSYFRCMGSYPIYESSRQIKK